MYYKKAAFVLNEFPYRTRLALLGVEVWVDGPIPVSVTWGALEELLVMHSALSLGALKAEVWAAGITRLVLRQSLDVDYNPH